MAKDSVVLESSEKPKLTQYKIIKVVVFVIREMQKKCSVK